MIDAMGTLRIGIARMNSTVGDLRGNLSRIATFIEHAERYKVDLLCFPEVALIGHSPIEFNTKKAFRGGEPSSVKVSGILLRGERYLVGIYRTR